MIEFLLRASDTHPYRTLINKNIMINVIRVLFIELEFHMDVIQNHGA